MSVQKKNWKMIALTGLVLAFAVWRAWIRWGAPLLVAALVALPGTASAAPFVCLTGKLAQVEDGRLDFQPVALRCESLGRIGKGLTATALVLSAAAFTTACTGIGAPATVWLEGAAIGVQTVDLIVGLLPCDNRTRDAEIKQMAESVVCDELGKMGVVCSMRR